MIVTMIVAGSGSDDDPQIRIIVRVIDNFLSQDIAPQSSSTRLFRDSEFPSYVTYPHGRTAK